MGAFLLSPMATRCSWSTASSPAVPIRKAPTSPSRCATALPSVASPRAASS
jgi:hypothetical protein